jgi:LPXTG-motif cell wall-anchored protein
MRRTIAVISATGALLFGGAGVASATVEGAPAPSSTSTTLADNTSDQHHDNTGLWGLVGLLGLGGLLGLKRRKDTDAATGVGTATTPRRGV